MAAAYIPIISGRHLNPAEQEKLERLDPKLTSTFIAAGYTDVRICEGTGEGNERTISFLRGLIGSPLVSLSALEFLSLTGRQISDLLETRLSELRAS